MRERNPWSESDLQFLRDNYGKMSAKAIGEHIDRSAATVYSKAQKLGLNRSRGYTMLRPNKPAAPSVVVQRNAKDFADAMPGFIYHMYRISICDDKQERLRSLIEAEVLAKRMHHKIDAMLAIERGLM